jgi:hypothetical protein
MSEGDLPYLQEKVLTQLHNLGPELAELAYETARRTYPQAPSLKELLAWDRQDPNEEPNPILARPSPQLGNRTVAEWLQSNPFPSSPQDPTPETSTPD